jgi:hypothetical protein
MPRIITQYTGTCDRLERHPGEGPLGADAFRVGLVSAHQAVTLVDAQATAATYTFGHRYRVTIEDLDAPDAEPEA